MKNILGGSFDNVRITGLRNFLNNQYTWLRGTNLIAKLDQAVRRDKDAYLLCLLPIHTKNDLHTWRKLHHEIRQFRWTGLLFPVNKDHIREDEHFRNLNIDPIRILPRPLYDRIKDLPAVTKNTLFPRTGGRRLIKVKEASPKQAWKGDTEYTRRKYDRWYWDMRLRRIPFTVALQKPMRNMVSNIQRKLHFHHTSAAVERNRLLKWPPRWLEEEYAEQC